MPVQGPTQLKYHPTKRKQLLATADVQILQAQVIDKDGRERTVVFWVCGPDIFFADKLTDLFTEKRHRAPDWVRNQLKSLPNGRRFDFMGVAKGSDTTVVAAIEAASAMTPTAKETPLSSALGDDDDLPGFKEA